MFKYQNMKTVSMTNGR